MSFSFWIPCVPVFARAPVVSSLPRLCRTQGCQTDETGVSSTGRDSHDRLGGRVPPASDASDAQTRRAELSAEYADSRRFGN